MVTNSAKPPSASSAFSLGAILFVLFKHKWKILLATLLAFGAAAGYYFRSTPVYISEAKILVNYVVDRDPFEDVESAAKTPIARGGDAVIQSEIDMLTSWDVAEMVVKQIGPEHFVGPGGSPSTATPVLVKGVAATAEKGGKVITVTVRHWDPQLARKAVDSLIVQYFAKHGMIHRSAESLKLIEDNVRKVNAELVAMESNLKKLKDNSNLPVVKLSANLDLELASSSVELDSAKVAYAEQEAWVNEIRKFMTASGIATPEFSAAPAQTSPESAGKDTAAVTPPPAPPDATPPAQNVPARDNKVVAEYQRLLSKLSLLQANSSSLLKYAAESQQVKDYDARLAVLQEQRWNMESKHPYLNTSPEVASRGSAASPQMDLLGEQGKLVSLGARVKALQSRVDILTGRVAKLSANASTIARLEREWEGKQKSFDSLVNSQVKAESNVMVPNRKVPGLGVIQDGTPAALDPSQRNKVTIGIAASGPVVGAALVLVFGLFLNRSIKRPSELEEHLGVPLLMTIPFFSGRARRRLHLRGGGGGDGDAKYGLTPWREGHFIRPFAESIRDRLGIYFERNKVTHKPKLIGVTGFATGAGVSTLAGGLAAALSEIADGRVLLVDMNVANGKAHSFSEGLPVISLNNALEEGGKLNASADNLYLARAEVADSGAGSLLLKKLFEILPNLKASEFDYMVFDLPLLNQTSPAAAMGGLLDTVMVVVEAETNSREDVKRGYRDLIASGANVSLIFNKARAFGPRALVGSI